MTQPDRAYALSIAGLDPSAGAGLLADVKTFEQCEVYGLGVCSALTYQNDTTFTGLEWVTTEKILDQLCPLIERFNISAAKFGIISSLEVLDCISLALHERGVKLIWDPIVAASAGYQFHQSFPAENLKSILARFSLITPNWNEIEFLMAGDSAVEAARKVSEVCPVLLKGGHAKATEATDYFVDAGDVIEFSSPRIGGPGKHGSGCILSAAITAELAKGSALIEACRVGQKYVRKALLSNDTLLAFHAW